MSYWDADVPENAPDRRRYLNDGIKSNPALKGLFGWVLGVTLPDATTVAMIKALNSVTRQEIQADKVDCWADGSYVNNVGRCISDPEEALNKAFRDIGNLQDADNVRKERIEAYIANRFYEEINNQGGDEDAIQAVIDQYTAEGFYDTNRYIAIGGPDGTGSSDDENEGGPEQTFEDLVEEFGEGIANVAKGIVDEWSDKITNCVGSPVDCIKKIATAVLDAGGVPDYCTDGTMNDPFFCTEKGPDDGGKVCWKDCVTGNLPGIPGLNLPLPPGVIDIGTYRDFENAVKTVGKTVGDIIEGNESCGPDDDQECTVGQVLEDLGTWAKETWEDSVLGSAIEGANEATVQDVLDWLRGILGPVTAGIIWADIEEEVTNVLTPVGPDTKTCPDGSVVDIDEDCPPDNTDCGPRPGYSGFQTAQLQYIWDRDCGPTTCLNGDPKTDPDGTNCEENQWTNDGPTPENCASFNRVHIPADEATKTPSSCGDCNEGWEEVGDECQEEDDPFVNQGPTAADCAEENKEFIPSTDVADSRCGGCLPGYVSDGLTFGGEGDECVSETPPYEPDCNSPRPTGTWSPPEEYAAWNDKCLETNCPQDGSLISDHVDNDCNKGLTTDDPNLTEGEECGEGQGIGFVENTGGQLQCTPYWDGNCSSPFPSGPTYTFNLQTAQRNWETSCSATSCSDGSDRSEEGYCPEDEGQDCETVLGVPGKIENGLCVTDQTTEQTCGDPNRDTNTDGSCADNCNTGFDQPEGYDVCTSIEQLCSDGASGVANGYGPENELCGTSNGCDEGQQKYDGENCDSPCPNDNTIGSQDPGCVTGTQECAKPDGTLTGATTESGCEECPEGQSFDFNGICVAVSGFTCDDYNRTTNEDKTCGPCKEGYETDTSLPNEPCVKIFDGCSAGFELVNGECTAIVCPEGQSYCIDTDGCVDIGTCPSDPPEEGGGSGGGGGGSGGSGMFAIEPTTVTADAQLLSRPEFPITDYLAGLFTNSTGGSA